MVLVVLPEIQLLSISRERDPMLASDSIHVTSSSDVAPHSTRSSVVHEEENILCTEMQ